uniref:Decapping protein 1, isoform A n=2 Tax=Drosophila melanogaster TaxID=7227 RepID=Q9W1H5_DROME|eukprot:NP_001163282.1 decapping protein 1, isoform B [Drosophila melanogaster]
MADESITRMNLAAIKKIDPYAKEIVDSSSHVAFYTFNSSQNEWEKTDVEGAFFIYHRNAEPFHSIFINNRLNTTSFVEPITGSLELQSQPPFLLYRNERSRIRGFWFYNSEECDRISGLVNGLLKSKDQGTNGQAQRHVSAPQQPKQDSSQPASIFNMLTKAQKDYNAQVSGGQPKTPSAENVTAGNVLKFFESAKQATAESLFHRVQPLSVDQLEKQQRAATPGEDLLPPAGRDNHESRLSPFQKMQQLNIQLLSDLKIGKSYATAQSPTVAPSSSALMANDDAGKCLRRLLAGDKPGPALMPPTMFDAPNNGNPEPQQPQQPQQPLLNSTQFVQAFTYLIQNDKEFANKLHKAYLNGCSNLLLDSSSTYQ